MDLFDTYALDTEASLNVAQQVVQAAGVALMAYHGAIGTKAPTFMHRWVTCWQGVDALKLHPPTPPRPVPSAATRVCEAVPH